MLEGFFTLFCWNQTFEHFTNLFLIIGTGTKLLITLLYVSFLGEKCKMADEMKGANIDRKFFHQ